jgi:hypothetical protein
MIVAEYLRTNSILNVYLVFIQKVHKEQVYEFKYIQTTIINTIDLINTP